MEIIDERTKNRASLEYLTVGDLFIDTEGDVCMKTDGECVIGDIKCVALRDGTLFEDWKTTKVEKVTGKLYIED